MEFRYVYIVLHIFLNFPLIAALNMSNSYDGLDFWFAAPFQLFHCVGVCTWYSVVFVKVKILTYFGIVCCI